MTTENVFELDGRPLRFEDGETIFEAARRAGTAIPSLCYDPRLNAFGGCRMCVVQVEGIAKPVASCTTKITRDMVVKTTTPKVERLRKTLLEMVLSENPDRQVSADRGLAATEMNDLAQRLGVRRGRFAGATSGKSRPEDDNPFILRDYDLCISCYRCVRVCAEREGDYALGVKGRGFATQITAGFDRALGDSTCTYCGQCVQTCPTGALGDKQIMRFESLSAAPETTRTICPYCGVGCSVDLVTKGDRLVGVRPAMDGPANKGALCVKGQFAYDFVQHADRLKTPLVRNEAGELTPASWDEALDRAARGLTESIAKHGRKSVYGVASGRAPNEAAYAMQKLMRMLSGAHYIDNCSRA